MENKQESTLELHGNTIVFDDGSDSKWKISTDDLELIGEYTTADGPHIDDYFFVFVVSPKHDRYDATFYTKGREDFLQALGKYLGYELKCGLCNSADLNSRVIWPEVMNGKKLYRFEPVRSGNLWNRFLQWLSPEFYFKFSGDVSSYLNICEVEIALK